MTKNGRVVIGIGWKPPTECDYIKLFKNKSAYRHISKVGEPDGSRRERVRLFLNEGLTDPETITFGQIMFELHREWFGCACWSQGGLVVRISIKTRDSETLCLARIEVAKHADLVLAKIFAARKR
jgi:hypothetical protein